MAKMISMCHIIWDRAFIARYFRYRLCVLTFINFEITLVILRFMLWVLWVYVMYFFASFAQTDEAWPESVEVLPLLGYMTLCSVDHVMNSFSK